MDRIKWNRLGLAAAALALGLALAGCGGGDPGSGASGSSGTLAEGSDPVVNGSSVSSGSAPASQEEGEQLHMMTTEETIDYFRTLDPKALGLEKDSMEEYQVYQVEKAIPVDNLPCMKITVYARSDAGTNEPEQTFLVARDGTAVYRLLEDETVEEVDLG